MCVCVCDPNNICDQSAAASRSDRRDCYCVCCCRAVRVSRSPCCSCCCVAVAACGGRLTWHSAAGVEAQHVHVLLLRQSAVMRMCMPLLGPAKGPTSLAAPVLQGWHLLLFRGLSDRGEACVGWLLRVLLLTIGRVGRQLVFPPQLWLGIFRIFVPVVVALCCIAIALFDCQACMTPKKGPGVLPSSPREGGWLVHVRALHAAAMQQGDGQRGFQVFRQMRHRYTQYGKGCSSQESSPLLCAAPARGVLPHSSVSSSQWQPPSRVLSPAQGVLFTVVACLVPLLCCSLHCQGTFTKAGAIAVPAPPVAAVHACACRAAWGPLFCRHLGSFHSAGRAAECARHTWCRFTFPSRVSECVCEEV